MAKLDKIWDTGGMELTIGRFKNILRNVEWRYSGKWYLDESDESTIIRLDHGALISEDLCKKKQDVAFITMFTYYYPFSKVT